MILGIDPSGNFEEGKGTTGMCYLQPGTTNIIWTQEIKAEDYESPCDYWHMHVVEILKLNIESKKYYETPFEISMEDYLLYADKSSTQINSKFETIQLIGIIKHACALKGIKLAMRNAGQVKKRWSNKILEHKGYIVKHGARRWATASHPNEPISRHVLDSIRHAVHYDVLENKKEG